MRQSVLTYVESADTHLTEYLKRLVSEGYRIVTVTPVRFMNVTSMIQKITEATIVVEK